MVRVVFLCVCSIIAGPLAIAGPGPNTSQCGAPKYKVAQTYVRSAELTGIAISIKPQDVTVQNLIALACQLRLDYQAERGVSVDIFNNGCTTLKS